MGKDGYKDTVMVALTAEDGTFVSVGMPSQIPSPERADVLRALYKAHVKHPGGHWKGVAVAAVPAALADDVADAMDFMGSIVDFRAVANSREWVTHDGEGNYVMYPTRPGDVLLRSQGYWAHGF